MEKFFGEEADAAAQKEGSKVVIADPLVFVGLHCRHSPTPDGYFGSFRCCLLNRRFWLFR